jgi:hypothetical protein
VASGANTVEGARNFLNIVAGFFHGTDPPPVRFLFASFSFHACGRVFDLVPEIAN